MSENRISFSSVDSITLDVSTDSFIWVGAITGENIMRAILMNDESEYDGKPKLARL